MPGLGLDSQIKADLCLKVVEQVNKHQDKASSNTDSEAMSLIKVIVKDDGSKHNVAMGSAFTKILKKDASLFALLKPFMVVSRGTCNTCKHSYWYHQYEANTGLHSGDCAHNGSFGRSSDGSFQYSGPKCPCNKFVPKDF